MSKLYQKRTDRVRDENSKLLALEDVRNRISIRQAVSKNNIAKSKLHNYTKTESEIKGYVTIA